MNLPLIFAAAGLALVVYWVVDRLNLPAPPPPVPGRSPLYALEALLQRELSQARLHIPARDVASAILACAAMGALIAAPFRNGLLMLIAGGCFGLLPYQMVRARFKARTRAIAAATEPALVQIAQLCEIRQHPFLALTDALPMLEPPLKAEFEQALAEAQAGVPLPDALRQMAMRCGDSFYLHQLAELVAINIRSGGDLGGSLQRLASRLRTVEELRAEEAAELFGYRWLTRILFAAALLPLPYWALTRSSSLQIFLTEPWAAAVLVWVVLSGLSIASLPYWLAIEE